jgi:hypothetical protein
MPFARAVVYCHLWPVRLDHIIHIIQVIDNKSYTKAITLSMNTEMNVLRFADYKVLTAYSEDNLQIGIFALKRIAKKKLNGNIN